MFHSVVRFSIDRLRLGGLQEDIPATHLPTDLVTWAIAFNCRHLGGVSDSAQNGRSWCEVFDTCADSVTFSLV